MLKKKHVCLTSRSSNFEKANVIRKSVIEVSPCRVKLKARERNSVRNDREGDGERERKKGRRRRSEITVPMFDGVFYHSFYMLPKDKHCIYP